MRSVLCRLAWAGVLGGWGFGAQAVLFDPATWALMGLGLVGVAAVARGRRQA